MPLRLRSALRRVFRRQAAAGRTETVTDILGPDGVPRTLVIYLPGEYHLTQRHYPVVYMQDGQNLFDDATSFSGSWRLAAHLDQDARIGANAIVVGIYHANAQRIHEYSPFADPNVGGGGAEDYVNWVADVLRPQINTRYRTLTDRTHTGIGGSSMGGLVSLYAAFARSDVFGFAAVMSPSLWFARGAIYDWVQQQPWVPVRFYLDMGAKEGERMLANAQRMRDQLIFKGYAPGERLRWVEDAQGVHHESMWGRRFRKALPALLTIPDSDQAS
jgi:predicted alpha/beta superfamily hydrolase